MTAHRPLTRTLALAVAAISLGACAAKDKNEPSGPRAADLRLNAIKSSTELDLAHTAFDAGQLDKAASRTRLALRLDPTSPSAHLLMARIHFETGNTPEARASVRRSLELAPDSPDAHYVAGLAYERDEDLSNAFRHYHRASELSPTDPMYIIAAAEMLVDAGRPEWAETMLREAPLTATDSGLKQMLAQVALLQGRAGEAVTLLGEARLITPNDPSLDEDLATALLLDAKPNEAAALLDHLMTLPAYATRTDIAHELARAHQAARNHSAARQAFLAAIDRAGEKAGPDLWAGLGETAFLAGDLASVRRAASRLVTLRPDSPDGYVLWALWHWRAGDEHAARRSINAGLAHAPNDPDLATLRAMISTPTAETNTNDAMTTVSPTDLPQDSE